VITLTAGQLLGFSLRRNAKPLPWEVGAGIIRSGWKADPLELELSPGEPTRLIDGNHRVAYLAQHGAWDFEIPVELVIRTLAKPPSNH